MYARKKGPKKGPQHQASDVSAADDEAQKAAAAAEAEADSARQQAQVCPALCTNLIMRSCNNPSMMITTTPAAAFQISYLENFIRIWAPPPKWLQQRRMNGLLD